uniref:Nck-associated protein 5 C-terminal domain-containing protein n=2 Tax=Oncorhynchus kisutch TaxID=8019 RepID=A0A8C7IDV2_ONCKI
MESEEPELRECDEAFESDEGNVESYLEEPESSRELLERLKELEAENSALALANESQREAYERCLDEVANHVVQALLNQKDLREECIKLKMRVFDLERQNKTLTELFAQKLHPQASHLQQLQLVSVTEPSTEPSTKPSTEPSTEPLIMDSDKLLVSKNQGELKSNGNRTQNGSAASARAPATSMEALSPFFKKKAHILEVLRKLEESDPLKFHPSSCLSPHHDLGQAPVSMERDQISLMSSEALPAPQRPVAQPSSRCHHSSSDSDIQDYANGEGALQKDHAQLQQQQHGRCQSCHILSQKSSLDSLLKCAQGHGASHQARVEILNRQASAEDQGASAQSTTPPQAAAFSHLLSADSTNQCYMRKTALDFLERTPEGLGTSDPFLSLLIQANFNGMLGQEPRKLQKHTDKHPSGKPPPQAEVQPSHGEDIKHIKAVMATSQSQNEDSLEKCCYLEVEAAAHNVNNRLHSSTSHTDHVETEPGYPKEQEVSDQICNGLYFSNETSVSKKVAVESYSPAPVPDRNSSAQVLNPSGKSKLALSSTSPSSGLSEVKPSPISSPSRLLKFLKIPPGINQAQPGNPLRLSPQLTRSSKIPCRNNNNYEVYHSPVLTRKATTTEREKQPSSSSSKTDSYPATHSAPTSPPKSEDIVDTPPMAKEIVFSSHFAPKPSDSTKAPPSSHAQRGSQKVPQYENVCPSDGTPQFLEGLKKSQYPQHEGPVEKHCQQDESLLSPPSSQHPDSSPGTADQDFSDQDTDSESPIWHKPNQHFSLPSSSSSAASKAQSSHPRYSSMRDRHQEHRAAPEPSQQNCEPAQPTQSSARRGDPKRLVQGKTSQSESSHYPFKERLAALGKLKSTEDLPVGAQSVDQKDVQSNLGKPPTNVEKSKTAERQGERTGAEQHRNQNSTDSLDGKPYPKTSLGSHTRGIGPIHESGTKSSATPSMIPKGEQETPFSPRIYVAKAEGPKIKMGTSSSNAENPPVVRSYGKCPITQSHHSKTAPSPQNSPTKVPSKSPSKVGQASSYPRGVKPIPEDRALAQRNPLRPEDKTKLPAGKKKTFGHAESFPPPPLPPRPSTEAIAKEDKKPYSSGPPVLQSAIEQKVMRGIEENMLKLQEQDQGQVSEPKQKASNGIANWFGLRKSKLPALNRKPEVSKFKINMSSSLSSSSASGGGAKDPKTGGPQKVVESLNISKLMEKAEDLRKALEEERAYVNRVEMDRSGRGHSCEVVMDQAQGQLSLMCRGLTAENFMQQLLNRVDERGAIPTTFGMTHRRLSFDSKRSRPNFSHQRNGISHTKSRDEIAQGSVMIGKDEVTSEDSLAESISSQHFTGSGASMRTLDSGIGTFPMPDYASSMAGKSIPKGKPQGEQGFSCSQGMHGAMMKVPRKAHTLERELSSLDEVNPFVLYGSGLEGKGTNMHLSSTIHEDIDAYGAHMQNPLTKNWTFPNLKGSARATDVYLDVQGDLGTPSRRSLKQCSPQRPLATDQGSLPLPLQTGLSQRGMGRTPSASEVGKDGGLDLVKERPEDLLSLRETPESLSDSLYDSLSSCGSQG